MESHDNNALFQQIGQIQGTLSALNSNISDFKNEFRTMTNAQNDKIENLRKEVAKEIKDLSDKVDSLEQFKANYDGAQAEARRSAQWLGGIVGGIISLIIGIGGIIIQIYYFHH